MAHTPGPWKDVEYAIYAPTGEIGNFGQEVDTTIAFVADTDDNGLSDAETKANARLIAAAPELLEACKSAETELVQMFKIAAMYGTDGPFMPVLDKIRAAITRAEGK